MANECVVYHKHLAGMDLTDGYIGISKHFEERMKQHDRAAYVQNSIYTVYEKMREHRNEVITTKIFEGTIQECFDYEEELRPNWHMGWNMAIGGGRPGSGYKLSKLWLDNRIWHRDHGEEVINKNNTCMDIERKYGVKNQNIAVVLRGRVASAYGWEFANAQLAHRVKTRQSQDWDKVYMRHQDGTHVSVTKSGNVKFHDYIGLPSKRGVVKNLFIGTSDKRYKWELSTEQEWNESTERLEFK